MKIFSPLKDGPILSVCGCWQKHCSMVGPKAPHEVRPTVQKGFGLGATRKSPWYSYATAPLDCKVGKEIDFRELVYLTNGTLLRAALI